MPRDAVPASENKAGFLDEREAMRESRSPGGSLPPLRAQGALAVGRENGKKRAEETVLRKACTGKTRENPKRALSTNGRAPIP